MTGDVSGDVGTAVGAGAETDVSTGRAGRMIVSNVRIVGAGRSGGAGIGGAGIGGTSARGASTRGTSTRGTSTRGTSTRGMTGAAGGAGVTGVTGAAVGRRGGSSFPMCRPLASNSLPNNGRTPSGSRSTVGVRFIHHHSAIPIVTTTAAAAIRMVSSVGFMISRQGKGGPPPSGAHPFNDEHQYFLSVSVPPQRSVRALSTTRVPSIFCHHGRHDLAVPRYRPLDARGAARARPTRQAPTGQAPTGEGPIVTTRQAGRPPRL